MNKPLSQILLLCFFIISQHLMINGQTEKVTSKNLSANSPLIVQAQNLLKTGKMDAVIETLTPFSRIYPTDKEVNRLLGMASYLKSDHLRAIKHLTIAVKQMPESSREYQESVRMLGLSHYLRGSIKDAILYLEQVNNWAPDSVEIAYVLGLSHIQLHNPDKARAAFARMFRVPANSASAYLLNAQMMIRQRIEELAEKELQKALELDPKLPQANFLLGELAIYRANIDLGIEFLQKEIAINPAFGMAYYRLGEAYTRQLKWNEAIDPLQKSIWLNPYFSGPYIVLGKVHLKKGDLQNAESILRHALKMDPNNFSGHHLLGQVLQQSNRSEEAKKEFEIANQLQTRSEKQ